MNRVAIGQASPQSARLPLQVMLERQASGRGAAPKGARRARPYARRLSRNWNFSTLPVGVRGSAVTSRSSRGIL